MVDENTEIQAVQAVVQPAFRAPSLGELIDQLTGGEVDVVPGGAGIIEAHPHYR